MDALVFLWYDLEKKAAAKGQALYISFASVNTMIIKRKV